METMDLEREKLALLAPDLTKDFPRSPRAKIGGFVVAARMLDKCRAELNGTAGDYHFNCPLDQAFFDFSGIDADPFKAFVGTGATDAEVADWIREHAETKDEAKIVVWNNKMRTMTVADLPPETQVFLEGYVDEFVPRNRPVYYWFDIYDLEEQRL